MRPGHTHARWRPSRGASAAERAVSERLATRCCLATAAEVEVLCGALAAGAPPEELELVSLTAGGDDPPTLAPGTLLCAGCCEAAEAKERAALADFEDAEVHLTLRTEPAGAAKSRDEAVAAGEAAAAASAAGLSTGRPRRVCRNGPRSVVKVGSGTTLNSLKLLIYQATEATPSQQRLVFDGLDFTDRDAETTVGALGIVPASTIEVFVDKSQPDGLAEALERQVEQTGTKRGAPEGGFLGSALLGAGLPVM